MDVFIGDFIRNCAQGALAPWARRAPWELTSASEAVVQSLVGACNSGYRVVDGVAIHETAKIEPGAVVKPPAVIGPRCFLSCYTLVRNGCWLEEGVILGPHTELKSSFVYAGSKLAHLNFVGDSVIGAEVNIEAGAVIANYRNEREDKRIRIRLGQTFIETGIDKFGALIGDHARIGANAVIAPGAIIERGAILLRLSLTDQS